MKNILYNKLVKLISISLIVGLVSFIFVYIYIKISNNFKITEEESIAAYNNDFADNWLKYDYPEIKSLCIQFITLTTSLLIVSITFAEKIVNFSQADNRTRILVVVGWIFMIFSIIFNFIALYLNGMTLQNALNDMFLREQNQYYNSGLFEPIGKTFIAITFGGLCFILGLVVVVTIGIKAAFKKT